MRFGIIGAGNVGTAIGYVLKQRGMTVQAVSDRLSAPLNRAKGYLGENILYTRDNADVCHVADVIAITTQDRLIAPVVKGLAAQEDMLKGKLFFHTSGVHPAELLQPLAARGARVGALHPLQTFPDIESAIKYLPETFIFVEGNDEVIDTLKRIGGELGAGVYRLRAEHKTMYHLSAVFLSNLICALVYAGKGLIERTGLELKPFFPIIRATLRNIENKGPLDSLTGPILRGDAETVSSHLEALDDLELHAGIYKNLSLMALEMAKEREALPEDIINNLYDLLKGVGKERHLETS